MKLAKESVSCLIFILTVIFFIFPPSAWALDGSVQPLDSQNNPINVLDENAAKAKITFSGLPDNDYKLCLGWGALPSDRDCGRNFKKNINSSDIVNGTWSIIVCGASVDGVLGSSLYPNKPGLKTDCGEDDYFHAHDYAFELRPKDGHSIRWDQGLQVQIYNPEIDTSPQNPTNHDTITLTFIGSRRPADKANRNDYKFELKRDDGLLPAPSIESIVIPRTGRKDVSFGPLQDGDWTLTIKRVDYDDGNYDTKVDAVGGVVAILQIHIDSNNGFIKEATQDSTGSSGPQSPFLSHCAEFDTTNGATKGSCKSVDTAIGPIGTTPQDFVKSVFSLILGLSGGIALLLIIYSGYKLMAARGNPEALQAARDQLIAAIVGLVFIIFSLVILQVIGVDILRIPGFGP